MSSSRSFLQPLLRQAAPNLARRFFAPRPCLAARNASSLPSKSEGVRSLKRQKQTPYLKAFRTQSTVAPAPAASSNAVKTYYDRARPFIGRYLIDLKTSRAEKEKFYPPTSERIVGRWLIASAVSVFGLVIFGGLTRLTESGLSITEWRPVTGSLPPLTLVQWDNEFHKYRASPEFQKLNPNMTMGEFQKIYYMEYLHRVWGRFVGLSFLLPSIYFIYRRKVSRELARNLLLINGLIITQGFVGWWMVKSGLKDDLFASGAVPRVSQYRLATHLMLAFGTYTAMLWNGLQVFREHTMLYGEQPNRPLKLMNRLASPKLRVFRIATVFTTGLAVLTAFSGALVAGLDAGLIYNEFPYMGLGLTPPSSELWSPFYARLADKSDLIWRNIFENPSLVQLDHRILAVSTFTLVNALFLYGRFSKGVRSTLTAGARRALAACFGLVWVQATLGLTTLLYLVPVPLASAHQAGALALLTGFTVLASRTFTPPRLARLLKARMNGVKAYRIAHGQRAADGSMRGPTKEALRKLNTE